MNGQETEVKFYVNDLKGVEERIQRLGALLIQPRTIESNLRFDLPDGSFRREGKVLRLRQDEEARITYKGAGLLSENVLSRPEFETTLGDFETGRKILESLGYVLVANYEKYRSTYELDNLHIMLDELPYGDFVEIEGPDEITLQIASSQFGLDFNAGIPMSYLKLFEAYCQNRELDPSQLTFSALKGTNISAEDLSVRAADESI